jgi:diguanylate cyclase (GGDEF)-like protein
MKTAFALCMAVAIWWLVRTCFALESHGARRIHDIIMPVAILGAAGLVALRHERHWSRPLRRFQKLIGEIRAGEAPIEQLDEVQGGLAAAMRPIQQLLHDIRQQKQAIAQLEQEIRQRVANRTDALERKMGSLLQQAARDGLTGLYNRRMLEQLLPKLIERCRLEGIDLALLMIDIDNFKQLNDTLGHAAGDELLRNVSRVIQSTVGERDLAVRYGGDEFVVLIPGASSESAQAMAQRLESLVDGLTRPLRVDRRPRLSIGMAQLSQLGAATPLDLIVAADRQLYEVKAARRAAARASSLCA